LILGRLFDDPYVWKRLIAAYHTASNIFLFRDPRDVYERLPTLDL